MDVIGMDSDERFAALKERIERALDSIREMGADVILAASYEDSDLEATQFVWRWRGNAFACDGMARRMAGERELTEQANRIGIAVADWMPGPCPPDDDNLDELEME